MEALWRIELLGRLQATSRDRVITRFRRHKTGVLLAYIAYYRRHPHPREELFELLWPGCDPAVGRDRLSTALSSLRHQLEPPGVPAGTVLVADRTSVGLNPAAVVTDVAEFEGALQAAWRARSLLEQRELLAEAIEAYRGELLPGYFEEWILLERQRLAETYLQALGRLVRHLEQAGEIPRALDYAHRVVAVDPLREEGQQELIRLLAAAGQPAAALHQYRELERLLAEELDAEPTPATRALVRQIAGQGFVRQPGDTGPRSPASVNVSPLPHSTSVVSPSLPTGTVTFLLADLGSTPSFSASPPAEPTPGSGLSSSAVFTTPAAHASLAWLGQEVNRRGGHVVQETGGWFLIVFQRVSDALSTAIAVQRAAATRAAGPGAPSDDRAPYPPTPLPRLALHTGEAGGEPGQYQGLALDHTICMLRAAHPGQILLSETTAALLRAEAEPGKPGAELIELGAYRLRDVAVGLETPARLFQATYPGMLRRRFPPPRAAPLHRPRLPLQLTRFFGREEELTQLGAWLLEPTTRLVTLTGPGGSGKTRLALAVAERMVERFQGAVWFVPLADLRDAGLLIDAVITALGLRCLPSSDLLEQAAGFLASQPCLLLLDNFEQLLEKGSDRVQELVERIPTLTCLVTSRRRLDLAVEREFPVTPLEVPGAECRVDRSGGGRFGQELVPDTVMQFPSVQLFVDRAQAARPDFQVTVTNAATIAELCRRLEGLPLAIELAGARTLALTPAQLLEQLARPLEVLVTRRRDAAARHRSLRATLDWSYQLLTPELRQFFAWLSVFRGGWTLAAAEHVCDQPKALEYLELLRENSLVVVEESGTPPRGARERFGVSAGAPVIPEMRYRLLEPLREYAREQLVASGELAAARKRHRDWYFQLAEQADTASDRLGQKGWLMRLEAELDNLRAALAWCQEEADANPAGECFDRRSADRRPTGAEAGLRLAGALCWLWGSRGHLTEGLQWLEDMLARGSQLSASVRAPALFGAAVLAGKRGHQEQSHSFLQAAGHEYDKVLSVVRAEGNRRDVLRALQQRIDIAVRLGDLDAAWDFSVEARQLSEELKEPVGLVRTLELMAGIPLARQDFRTAGALLEERLAICRELGEPDLLIHALGGLGHVERGEGRYARARALYLESLPLRRNLGDHIAVAQTLEDLAVLAGRQRQTERAIRLLGAAEAFLETLGARLPVAVPAEYERTVAEGRALLGEARFTAVWAEGRKLDLEQALAYATSE